MKYQHLQNGYTIEYVEEMYAHYANLLFDRPDAPDHHRFYWIKMMNHYYDWYEKLYNFIWIAAQLPLQNPKP